MIELDHNALFFALKKEAFHSSLLDMELAGKTEQVLLRDYQMHPFRPIVLHVDFQRVDATTKVTKKVPLHYVNEENSPAVKTDALRRQPRRQRAQHPVPGLAAAGVHHRRPRRADQGPVAARERHQAAAGHQGRHARQAEPGDRLGQRPGGRGRGSRAGAGGRRAPRPRRPRRRRPRSRTRSKAPRRGMPKPRHGGAFFCARPSIIAPMIRLIVGLGNPGPNTPPPATTPASGSSTRSPPACARRLRPSAATSAWRRERTSPAARSGCSSRRPT